MGLGALLSVQNAFSYPITIQSCGKPVTITHRPTHAVIHDVNMAEMAFALHLQPFMAGVTGISGWNKRTPAFQKKLGALPEIATHYPTLEQLLNAGTDFFFAGWNYGMHVGGDVTPETLAAQGIPTLVLSESCMRVGQTSGRPTLDLLYDDEERLGQVFDRTAEAQSLVEGWKNRVRAVQSRLVGHHPLRVFLYDSGRDRPFTAGKYALATELIWLGGGQNIFSDLPTNWGSASWENVAVRDPEAILIVDYGSGISESLAFLRSHPLLIENAALKANRILAVRYDEMTPSPANIDAIEKISVFLHPETKP
ncbi:ABC transporter substrate-binding protein [Gluconobacter frateurii]|uniref:Fe3+-hydroxamate ABC transporter substrate-binding periplasmic protein n=1 Tax=Gluconobacter frateurii NRIC 0228 TaxID=1307946 RepID=A0ABQ0QEQ0_9PROT|nr:Fe3+-hydroxamate ABC transporter substrate-binding periplasmic protein [Gluconobacter frateurii NRIC 0228]GLP90568.1 ABC transporter substrate-binding protein [Gluconobacter frateurii]